MKENRRTDSGKRKIFCRKNNGEFFKENFYFRLSQKTSGGDMLNLRTFGESTFLPGCSLNMKSPYWVFQVQISGNATLNCENTINKLSPGDLLAIPPRMKYSYSVTGQPIEKFFITMQHSPLLDIMLLGEIEKNGIFIPQTNDSTFPEIFQAIRQAMFDGEDEQCSVRLYQLIYRLRELLVNINQPMNFRQKLKNAVEKIELMTSLDMLAAEFNMPKHTLIRTFHKELGTTPINYMISMRLEHAKKLLTFSELSIAEIATACGYSSPAFFSSEFRKKFNITPSACRKKYFSPQP